MYAVSHKMLASLLRAQLEVKCDPNLRAVVYVSLLGLCLSLALRNLASEDWITLLALGSG